MKVKEETHTYKLGASDLLSGNSRLNLFIYTPEEYKTFSEGFDASSIRSMLDGVSRAVRADQPDQPDQPDQSSQSTKEFLTNYIHTLTPPDLRRLDEMVRSFTDTDPNMLWDMLQPADRGLYEEPDKFYSWLSTLSDETVDGYIYKVADGKRLHPQGMYTKDPVTTVDIIDGYIAISSSNLSALTKFKDRVLKANSCTYEHRVKTHEGIKIYSFIFNMNTTGD